MHEGWEMRMYTIHLTREQRETPILHEGEGECGFLVFVVIFQSGMQLQRWLLLSLTALIGGVSFLLVPVTWGDVRAAWVLPTHVVSSEALKDRERAAWAPPEALTDPTRGALASCPEPALDVHLNTTIPLAFPSTNHKIPLVIVGRLFGNVAFPFQGLDQYELNLPILSEMMSNGVYYLPVGGAQRPVQLLNLNVINTLLNVTAERMLVDEFRKRNAMFERLPLDETFLKGKPGPSTLSFKVGRCVRQKQNVPGLSWVHWSGVSRPVLYMTNQNRGRNHVVELMIAAGADFLLPLDGNIALTQEGLTAALQPFFEPEVDLTQPDTLINMPFILRVESTNITATATYGKLTRGVLGEAQVTFHKLFPRPFFDARSGGYGKQNKARKLMTLSRRDAKCDGMIDDEIKYVLDADK